MSSLRNSLFWNKTLLLILEAYYMLVLCCLINMKFGVGENTLTDKLSLFLAGLFFALVIVYPFFVFCLLWTNFSQLDSQKVKN
jgi:hypothetical protein